MNHPAIVTTWVSSPDDFDAARSLLPRYRRWLKGLVGSELTTVQPSSLRELADLEHSTSPRAVDGEPAGVVGVHRPNLGVGEPKRSYVAPEARDLGMGRDLVGAAAEAAANLGFDVFRSETHAGHMPAAVALYRKLGFRETEPYHSVVGVDGVLTMELRSRLHRLSA